MRPLASTGEDAANGLGMASWGQGQGLPVLGTVDWFCHKSLLFPAQDTLNNNSLGKKHSWQDRVSRSSSPLKTGKSGLFPLWTFMCPQSPLQRANLTVSSLLGRGKLPVPQPWAGPSEVTCSMRGLTPEPAMDLLPQGGFVIVSVSTC